MNLWVVNFSCNRGLARQTSTPEVHELILFRGCLFGRSGKRARETSWGLSTSNTTLSSGVRTHPTAVILLRACVLYIAALTESTCQRAACTKKMCAGILRLIKLRLQKVDTLKSARIPIPARTNFFSKRATPDNGCQVAATGCRLGVITSTADIALRASRKLARPVQLVPPSALLAVSGPYGMSPSLVSVLSNPLVHDPSRAFHGGV